MNDPKDDENNGSDDSEQAPPVEPTDILFTTPLVEPSDTIFADDSNRPDYNM